jgi:hypothetical protein
MVMIHSKLEGPQFALGPEEDPATPYKPLEEMTALELWLAVTHCSDARMRRKLEKLWRQWGPELSDGQVLGDLVDSLDILVAFDEPGRTGPRARFPGAGRPR